VVRMVEFLGANADGDKLPLSVGNSHHASSEDSDRKLGNWTFVFLGSALPG